jgi:hypothetical protein
VGIRRRLWVLCLISGASTVSAQTSNWVLDPAGDSKQGGPDLIAVAALASNGVLTLRARFAPPSFNARTTRVAWVLDTDQNPDTGSPGLLGAPGVGASGVNGPVDERRIGAEAVAVLAGICNSGSLSSYDGQLAKWILTEELAAIALPDGFDAYVVLSSLGMTDANISFKTLAYTFSGDCPPKSISLVVQDVAPDVGNAAAVAQDSKSDLAGPQPLAPPDGSRFDILPRKTTLRWSGVPDAAAYLVQVQYQDLTSATGWRPLIFRRVSDTSIDFNFVGAQAGRWRVWGIDQNGLAGAPTAWTKFEYSR